MYRGPPWGGTDGVQQVQSLPSALRPGSWGHGVMSFNMCTSSQLFVMMTKQGVLPDEISNIRDSGCLRCLVVRLRTVALDVPSCAFVRRKV